MLLKSLSRDKGNQRDVGICVSDKRGRGVAMFQSDVESEFTVRDENCSKLTFFFFLFFFFLDGEDEEEGVFRLHPSILD